MHALKASRGADNVKLAQVETLQQCLKDLSEQLVPKTIFELDLAVSSKALCLVAVYSLPLIVVCADALATSARAVARRGTSLIVKEHGHGNSESDSFFTSFATPAFSSDWMMDCRRSLRSTSLSQHFEIKR
jgi:hypothetical protein